MFASDHILSCPSAHLTNVSPSQPVLASLVLTTQLSEIRGKIEGIPDDIQYIRTNLYGRRDKRGEVSDKIDASREQGAERRKTNEEII